MDIWTYESVEYVTVAGEAWLASASEYPRSLRALWEYRPWAPTVLPCGRAFDVVNLPAVFGRRVLDELWAGPGCGPVAAFRGRILVFARPGTAHGLRPLLRWEEWGHEVPPVLCHGPGDAVTVPPLHRPADLAEMTDRGAGRWIVAPDTNEPWLPGTAVLLRACVRAARTAWAGGAPEDAPDGTPDAAPRATPGPAPAGSRPAPTRTRTPLAPRPLQLLPDPAHRAETDF